MKNELITVPPRQSQIAMTKCLFLIRYKWPSQSNKSCHDPLTHLHFSNLAKIRKQMHSAFGLAVFLGSIVFVGDFA